MKIVAKNQVRGFQTDLMKLKREITILRNWQDHPNFLEVEDFLMNSKYLFVVTNYMSQGSLLDQIVHYRR